MPFKENRVPPTPCPYCDKLLDAAGSVAHDHAPKPGDVTVCFYCSQISIFTPTLGLRRATEEEIRRVRNEHPAAEVLARTVRQVDRRDQK